MRIGIDCRLSGVAHAGIGRYIQNLIIRLPKLGPMIDWVYFFHDQKQSREILDFDNVTKVICPVKHYSLAEQLRLPRFFAKHKLDLLHVPHFNVPIFYPGKLVVTIHDLLWHHHRGVHVTTLSAWQYWLKYLAYRVTVNRAVSKAIKILVPAETVKKTVIKHYPQTKNKIKITLEGVDENFLKLKKKSKSATKTAKKVLIYVGSLYPHKNIHLVINALSKLPKYELWIVGARNVFQEQVKKYVERRNLSARVKFLGYLSDQQLVDKYQQATALVQPSLSEGFGLTGLEAMAAGLPVLASDIPIFHEIYQDSALFFNPQSSASFVKAAKKLEKSRAKSLVGRGKKLIQDYSWDKMAKQTFKVYENLL